jgi:hypothetical protein
LISFVGESTEVVVAVDGVYQDHEELSSSITHYHNATEDHDAGCPTLDGSVDTVDETVNQERNMEHGTPVYGIIHADGNWTTGISNMTKRIGPAA